MSFCHAIHKNGKVRLHRGMFQARTIEYVEHLTSFIGNIFAFVDFRPGEESAECC